jgi:hypothetical protein
MVFGVLTMDRRSACLVVLALAKASVAFAAQEVARIAGPRWNVNGNWSPSIEEVRAHLRNAHHIDPGGLSLQELLAMHDNAHNRMGGGHRKTKESKGGTKGYRKA